MAFKGFFKAIKKEVTGEISRQIDKKINKLSGNNSNDGECSATTISNVEGILGKQTWLINFTD